MPATPTAGILPDDLASIRNEIFTDELSDILTRQIHTCEHPLPTGNLSSQARLRDLIEILQVAAKFSGEPGESDHDRAEQLLTQIHKRLCADDVPSTPEDREFVKALNEGDYGELDSLAAADRAPAWLTKKVDFKAFIESLTVDKFQKYLWEKHTVQLNELASTITNNELLALWRRREDIDEKCLRDEIHDRKRRAAVRHRFTTEQLTSILAPLSEGDLTAYLFWKDVQGPRAPKELYESAVLGALLRHAVAGNLWGLALSGGGIRSASFNLGVIQSLHAHGVLQRMDYLSTVSGGGYIGSHLSATMRQPRVSFDSGCFPLEPGPNARYSDHVKSLVRGGRYLNRPLEFLSHYLTGLMLNNLALISTVIFACTLVCFLWRVLDWPPVHTWLYWVSGGQLIDATRPFLPCAALLALWFWAVAVGFWERLWEVPQLDDSPIQNPAATPLESTPSSLRWKKRLVELLLTAGAAALAGGSLLRLFAHGWVEFRSGSDCWWAVALVGLLAVFGATLSESVVRTARRYSKWFLCLAGGTFLVGWVIWLANPHINTLTATQATEMPNNSENNYLTGQRHWIEPLMVAVLIGMLPFLKPWELLRSGERPRATWHSWVFKFASLAALAGLPLLVVYYFGRHDFAGKGSKPSRALDWSDFENWSEFWSGAYRAQQPATRRGQDIPKHELLKLIHAEAAKAAEPAKDKWKILTTPARNLNHEQHWKYRVATDDWNTYFNTYTDKVWLCAALTDVLKKPDLIVAFLDAGCSEETERAVVEFGRRTGIFPAGTGRTQDPVFRVSSSSPAGSELSNAQELALFQSLLARAQTVHDLSRKQDSTQDKCARLSGYMAEDECLTLNKLLLRVFYPAEIRRITLATRPAVIAPDQNLRFWILIGAFTIALGAAMLVHLNDTSPQRFYRDCLSEGYIKSARAATPVRAVVSSESQSTTFRFPPPDRADCLELKDLRTVDRGAPYHLLSAALNGLGADQSNPLDSTRFLFSRRWCGSHRLDFERTATYRNGTMDLASAMAISGAALSPLRVRNPLVAFLMTVLNLRLGEWSIRPGFNQEKAGVFRRYVLDGFLRRWPTMFGVAIDYLYARIRNNPLARKFFFLSDGGHDENLGIEQLLIRRCSVIVACDAGQDEEHSFVDFVKLYRRMRVNGIQFYHYKLDAGAGDRPMTLEELELIEKTGLTAKSYFLARIGYPGRKERGLLIYMKPSFVGNEELDLRRHRVMHPHFPHDPTSDVMYDEETVESYRQLGNRVAESVCGVLRVEEWNGAVDADQLILELQPKTTEFDFAKVLGEVATVPVAGTPPASS